MAGRLYDDANWNSEFTSDPDPETSSIAGLLPRPQSSSSISSTLSTKLRPMADLLGLRKKKSSERPPPLAPPATPAHTPPLNAENGSDFLMANGVSDTSASPPHQASDPPPRRRLLPFIASFQPYLTLENSGSVARDHLASERTFLAYVRTSLAIASTGVALVQLFTISAAKTSGLTALSDSRGIQVYARPLGATTVLLGMIVLSTGVVRYFTIQSALTKGKFPVARTVVVGISIALGVLVIITFAVLVSVKRSP